MGLQYRNERLACRSRSLDPLTRTQKGLFLFGTVLLPYFNQKLEATASEERWQAALPDNHWRNRLLWFIRLLGKCQLVLQTAVLFHFCLGSGKYRSLIELLVGARLVPRHRHGARGAMPFDFLNQQIIFHGVAEFSRWALPAYMSIRAGLGGVVKSLSSHSNSSISQVVTPVDGEINQEECCICRESVVMPFRASCGHVGCYVCLKGATKEDVYARCTHCGSLIGVIRRHEPWSEQ